MKAKTTKKTAPSKTKKKSTEKAKTKAKPKVKTAKKKVAPKATKKKVESTHILAIVDKSGSMNPVMNDAIGGFNSFLSAQKAQKDPATMNVVLFSDHDKIVDLHKVDKLVPVKDIEELTEKTYIPHGSTALNDAIVGSMTNLKKKLNDLKPAKRPDKILVLIITDGEENSSREYPKQKVDEVKKLIQLRKEENWQFIFMCSTEATAFSAESLGVSKGNVFQYSNDTEGNQRMFFAAASAATTYRSTSLKSKGFAKVSNNLLAEDEVDDVKSDPNLDENIA